VAIKQIIHKRNNAEQIAREVSMMMRFQHPHLVRAYHYVTWSSAAAAADPGDLPEVSRHNMFDWFDQHVTEPLVGFLFV
jgi:serine/threonine protein kinase